MTAEKLLDACSRHGEVTDLARVEDGAERLVVSRTRRVTPCYPWTPDITFYCPVYAEPWGPWRLLRDGMGGSEESVVYLSHELAARGLNVQVYAPLDEIHAGVHVEGSVRWRSLSALDTTREIPGISVSCRAPHALRMPCFDPERLVLWHQDAHYPGWSPAIARAMKHIFQSRWHRDSLLVPIEVAPQEVQHVVAGNGIPPSALGWDAAGKRDPFACAYISSPIRGLMELLDAWGEIRMAVPEATLNVFYGWESAGVGQAYRSKMMQIVHGSPGVTWRGRLPAAALEKVLPTMGVWTYPCASQNEGYCISGVRAAAAGLVPVYRRASALGETQYPSPFAVDEVPWTAGGKDAYVLAAVAALQASANGFDREPLRAWAAERTWKHTADLIMPLLSGETMAVASG